MRTHDRRRSWLIGILILLVGVVLLVDETDLLAFSLRGAITGLLLLVLGLYMFFVRWREDRLDRVLLPGLLVLFGALSVVDEFVTWDAMAYFVPLLVILVGLAFLTRSWRRTRSRHG